jgi:hypothetical protein
MSKGANARVREAPVKKINVWRRVVFNGVVGYGMEVFGDDP